MSNNGEFITCRNLTMFFSFCWDADCFLVPKFKHCRDAGLHCVKDTLDSFGC